MKHRTFEELAKEIISEVFQSKDMRDYLCQNLDLLDKRNIVDIVRKSFVPLERKLEFFEELSVFEDKEEVEAELKDAQERNRTYDVELVKKYSYFYQAIGLKEALNQLKEDKEENGVLLLTEYMTSEGTDEILGNVPFLSYEKLDAYIKSSISEQLDEESSESVFWHAIEKYREVEDGELELRYTYYVFDGKLIYYVDDNSEVDCSIWDKDLNIPVPFSPGDIVVCDGKPACEEICAFILRTGDNIDCCSLVGLCKRKDGTFESVPVKHSNMFYESDSIIMVPPLYSMKRVSQQVREEEPEMLKISNFVKGDEDRGFIVENNVLASIAATDVTDMFIEKLEQEYEIWYEKYRK